MWVQSFLRIIPTSPQYRLLRGFPQPTGIRIQGKARNISLPLIPLVLDPLSTDKVSIMISYVDHHLYIGEKRDVNSPPSFITAVFWTALDSQISPPPNVLFGRLPLKEHTKPNPVDLEMGVQWLTRHLPNHHILVACEVGFSRSISVIIAYLCCMHGLSFEKAHKLVTQKRPGTTPLPQLASLIEQLRSKTPTLSGTSH